MSQLATSTTTTATTTTAPAAATASVSATAEVVAAVSAAAAAVSATATTAESATAPRGSIGCFIDAQIASVEFRTVHFLSSELSRLRIVEGDEAESSRATSVAIEDDFDLAEGAEALEGAPESLFVGVPAKSSDEELVAHDFFLPCSLRNVADSARPEKNRSRNELASGQ